MGTYLNPGNSGFAEIVSDDYIDKTGMIDLINRKINKPQHKCCVPIMTTPVILIAYLMIRKLLKQSIMKTVSISLMSFIWIFRE